MPEGNCKWFNAAKGFGFIRTREGVDCFVHYTDILTDGYKELVEDEAVSFDTVQTEKGFQAKNVRLV